MTITPEAFVKKYDGKLVDVDGNGAWCVDIAKVYAKDVAGAPAYTTLSGNGKDWTAPNGPWSSYFTQVPANALVKAGDIVSWGSPQGVVDGVVYGHVGVAVADSKAGQPIKVFSQRQSASTAAACTITLSRTGFLGGLRPKNLARSTTTKNKYYWPSAAALAAALGLSLSSLTAVNPDLDVSGPVTPGEVVIPTDAPKAEPTPEYEGGEATTAQHAAQAVHYVNRGDTLYSIATRYGLYAADGGVDWQAIVDANRQTIEDATIAAGLPIDDAHPLGWWIFPGQELTIPAS